MARSMLMYVGAAAAKIYTYLSRPVAAALTSRTWRLPAVYICTPPQDQWYPHFYHFSYPFIFTSETKAMSNTCKLPSIRLLSLDLPLPGQQEDPYWNPMAASQRAQFQAYPLPYEPIYYQVPGSQGSFSYAQNARPPALGNLGATPSLTSLLFVGPRASQGQEPVYDRLVSTYPHPVTASAAYSFQSHPLPRLPSSVASVSGWVPSDCEGDHKHSATNDSATVAPVVANAPPPAPGNTAAAASTQSQTPAQTPPTSALSPSATPQPAEVSLPESPRDSSWKPRKKRQCPECHLYFSNLATHKSTHLKPTNRPHLCKICHRGFARPNDLFRHFKCHWKEIGADKGQFRCPFKIGTADSSDDHCCHTLGIFSRCDTYKNHLKAIHFQYPSGTKKSQRNNVPGNCRLCQKQFSNVDDWITNHIDTNECPFASH